MLWTGDELGTSAGDSNKLWTFLARQGHRCHTPRVRMTAFSGGPGHQRERGLWTLVEGGSAPCRHRGYLQSTDGGRPLIEGGSAPRRRRGCCQPMDWGRPLIEGGSAPCRHRGCLQSTDGGRPLIEGGSAPCPHRGCLQSTDRGRPLIEETPCLAGIEVASSPRTAASEPTPALTRCGNPANSPSPATGEDRRQRHGPGETTPPGGRVPREDCTPRRPFIGRPP